MKLLTDASNIIAFYSENELNEPCLLNSLKEHGYQIIVPQKVYEEIKRGKKSTILHLCDAIRKGIVKIDPDGTEDEINAMQRRNPKLDSGEIQVLLMGEECKEKDEEYYCVIDEGPGRQIAKRRSLCLQGTIGILNLLEALKIISPAKREILYRRLECSTFRI